MTDVDRILWNPGDVTIRPPTLEEERAALGVPEPRSPPLPGPLPEPFQRPNGVELFNAMSKAEQDAALGADAAEKVRRGELTLADLVQRSRIRTAEDFITQRPLNGRK